MANERVALDGFRYDGEPISLWNSDRGEERRAFQLNFHDDARGVTVELYFSMEAWAEFKRDLLGTSLLRQEDITRLGI